MNSSRFTFSFSSTLVISLALSAATILCACDSVDPSGTASADLSSGNPPDTSRTGAQNPPISSTPATGTPTSTGSRNYTTAVLLFNGAGVSTSDWQSTEQIVKSQGLSYTLANSAQLDAMSLDQLISYGTIIVPGGAGGTIANGVSPATRIRLRQAVRDHGVGYVGFCAGAWVAVGPEAMADKTAFYGFAIAPGNVLSLFLPGGQSPTAAMVPASFPDGTSRSLVWWGGPSTPEWKNGVIARYDTGEAAISETFSGKGLVVISGPHPEAPQGWRATAGKDSDGLDYDIAIKMIHAAIDQVPLSTF
ncbi:MAG: hypothetical protein H7222_09050 [Methylotenera sp.]|nr:hypothetical protein [Oligoflexia bacterium]